MPAPKNNNFNPKGRPKGAPNKTTTEIRQAYQSFVEGNIPQFEEWLQHIEDPAKRFDIIIKISEYFIPKLNRQEVTGSDGKDLFKNITVNFNLPDDSDRNEL